MLTYDVELVELQPQPAAVVRGHARAEDLPTFLGAAFGEVMQVLSAQGITPAGPPFGRYRPAGDGFDVEAGFPATRPVTAEQRVVAVELPGGTVARVVHQGAYSTVAAAYASLSDWVEMRGYAGVGVPWECYLDGPEVPEPRTLVCLACRRVESPVR